MFASLNTFSQKDSVAVKGLRIQGDIKIKNTDYNPLKPAKAAFYSTLFPGMGQVYNKKYWKAPIVWASLAAPTYYYLTNNSEYKRYRRAFKLREAGLQDEFTLDNGTEILSRNALISAQKQLRKNRDLSLFTFVLVYVLQIVEASVNAHLLQFDTSDNLSFEPLIKLDPIQIDAPTVGLTLKYTF